MAELDLTPEQEAVLREACGLRPQDRELRPEDIVVVLETRAVIEAEARRWSWG